MDYLLTSRSELKANERNENYLEVDTITDENRQQVCGHLGKLFIRKLDGQIQLQCHTLILCDYEFLPECENLEVLSVAVNWDIDLSIYPNLTCFISRTALVNTPRFTIPDSVRTLSLYLANPVRIIGGLGIETVEYGRVEEEKHRRTANAVLTTLPSTQHIYVAEKCIYGGDTLVDLCGKST